MLHRSLMQSQFSACAAKSQASPNLSARRARILTRCVLAAAAALASGPGSADEWDIGAPWYTDFGFGTFGRVETAPLYMPIASNDRTVFSYHALLQQTPGAVVFARLDGNDDSSPGEAGLRLERFDARGARDATFGVGGHRWVPFPDPEQPAFAVRLAADRDDRIYADVSRLQDIVLCAFDAQGGLRTAFGAGRDSARLPAGCLSMRRTRATPIAELLDKNTFHLAVDADQSLVVAAQDGAQTWWIERLDCNGQANARFGERGRVTLVPSAGEPVTGAALRGLALGPGNTCFTTGTVTVRDWTRGIHLYKIGADGQPDRAFGERGQVVLYGRSARSWHVAAHSTIEDFDAGPLALDAQGQLLLSSVLWDRSVCIPGADKLELCPSLGVLRFDAASGRPDARFGDGGITNLQATIDPILVIDPAASFIGDARLRQEAVFDLLVDARKGEYATLTGLWRAAPLSTSAAARRFRQGPAAVKSFILPIDAQGRTRAQAIPLLNYASAPPFRCQHTALGPVMYGHPAVLFAYAEGGGCYNTLAGDFWPDDSPWRFLSRIWHQ